MAWPPPTLPTNRTDATPQQTNHPADHNALAQAINDTVGQVQFLTQSAQRFGTVNTQTGQTYTAGQTALMGWTTVSDPTWGTGATLTVPAGKGGVYAATVRIGGPIIPAGAFADVIINMGGSAYPGFIPPSKTQIAVCTVQVLDVGAQISVQIYNPNPDAQFYSGALSVLRVST